MPSSERKTLRFAVGSLNEYCSAIWRLWVQGNDVYLGARTSVAFIKLSLHRSGIWRLAWTSPSGVRARNSADRVEKRWTRPAPFRTGWVQGPSLVIPATSIKRRFTHVDAEGGGAVTWYAPPRPCDKYHFTILFATPDAPVDSWNSVFRPDDEIVGVLDQRNGTKVVLARRVVRMNEEERARVDFATSDMKITYPTEIPGRVEGSLFSAETDDARHPYLLEIPLGWDNVFLATNSQQSS